MNARDCMGTSVLAYAYAFKHGKVARILISKGADEDARSFMIMPRWDRQDGESSDDDERDERRRRKRGGDREEGGTKGRLPRECAGLREKVFPNVKK